MNFSKKKIFILVAIGLFLSVSSAYAGKIWLEGKGNPAMGLYAKAQREGLWDSKEGLLKYKAQVLDKQKLVKKNPKKEYLATVSFSRRLSLEEVENLAQRYDITVTLWYLTGIGEDGEVWTFAGGSDDGITDDGSMLPLLEEAVAGMQRLKDPGFIDISGWIKGSRLEDLQSENRVFLVDISADETFIRNPEHKCMSGLYYWAKKYGLAQ